MWLQDIERAIKYLRAKKDYYKDYVFTRAMPAQDGVVFVTTHFTKLYVHNDGRIEELRYD